jgi:tRNA(fMet)-specific endonuclease VapC
VRKGKPESTFPDRTLTNARSAAAVALRDRHRTATFAARRRQRASFDPLHAGHTSIISDLIRNPQGKAAKRIAKVGEDNICTSIIVAAELRYECAKNGSPRLHKAVEDLLGEIDVLPFEVPADTDYGGIRAGLEAAGKPIGGNDLLIATHARATVPRS